MKGYDGILIKSGILVSKEHDSVVKDVLVRGSKIVDISDNIGGDENYFLMDAKGKIVAPGFVSIHSHSDFYLPLEDHPTIMKGLLYQGITTCVGGNCGFSNYPVVKNRIRDIESYQGFLYCRKPEYKWETLDEYLDHLDGKIVFNFMPLVGHGTLRVISNGFNREMSSSSMELMKKMLVGCMESGCFGISSGLMYMPGTFSTTDELVELAKIVKRYPNTIYSLHLRGYSNTFIEAVNEAVEIGRRTGITVQISHLGPFGIQFGPKIDEVLEILQKAKSEGVNISYDSLAYCGGSTTIMALIPPWFYKDGLEKFLEDIKSDEFFKKVIECIESYVPRWPPWKYKGWTDNFVRSLGWENLYVLGANNKDFIGKNFVQIGEERNMDKYQALREVLLEERGKAIMYMAGVGSCIDDRGDMTYFDKMLENPMCLMAVDEVFSADGRTMPYAYGTFPRVINRYVKEKKTLTLKQAIEKFTSNVMEKFNIRDRGYLRRGAYADIVVFDLNNVKDYPDIFAEKPRLSTGVDYLIVNGEIVINKGDFNEVFAGRAMRNC